MANRVKDILGLVTIEHPYVYLGCKAADLRAKPHHERPRAKSDEWRDTEAERDGVQVKIQIMEDGTKRKGRGAAVKSYRDKSIRGEQLLPFMEALRPQAVLIYVPDEKPGKPKWKCELRCMADWRIQLQDSYPDHGFESLPEAMRLENNDSTELWENLRASTIRICGLWVNPTLEVGVPNNRCVNLVLGPVEGHRLRSADLQILADHEHCWIEYTEQSHV